MHRPKTIASCCPLTCRLSPGLHVLSCVTSIQRMLLPGSLSTYPTPAVTDTHRNRMLEHCKADTVTLEVPLIVTLDPASTPRWTSEI